MSDTPEKEVIDHAAAEAAIQQFSFTAPKVYDGRKAIVKLTSNERSAVAVHCLGQGGENNLHFHSGVDITWMVLKGRARFYGPENEQVRGEFGPMEGLVVPAGAKYWFESCGKDDLELLQIKAYTKGRGKDKRIDAAPRDYDIMTGASHFDASDKSKVA